MDKQKLDAVIKQIEEESGFTATKKAWENRQGKTSKERLLDWFARLDRKESCVLVCSKCSGRRVVKQPFYGLDVIHGWREVPCPRCSPPISENGRI